MSDPGGGDAEWNRPEPREAHCQCCGGYAGHGPDPSYCGTCRAAGEHLVTCPMCKERVSKFSFDEFCPTCDEIIDELDRFVESDTGRPEDGDRP